MTFFRFKFLIYSVVTPCYTTPTTKHRAHGHESMETVLSIFLSANVISSGKIIIGRWLTFIIPVFIIFIFSNLTREQSRGSQNFVGQSIINSRQSVLFFVTMAASRAEVLKIYKNMLRECGKFSFYNYR